MARGVGRPPKQVLSRNSSQEVSDGENSGGSNGENSGINLLQPAPSSILMSGPSTPLKQTASSSSHNSSYVAPQWLLEKKTAKYFSVPIPGVPQEVQDAIEQRLLVSGDLAHKLQARKSHKLLAQIKQLKDQLAVVKQERQEQEEMLAKAVSTKEKKLAAMRKQKTAEMEQKLQKLEDKLQHEKDVKLKEAEDATRKKIEAEFEVAFEKEEESRKRKRKEEEEQAAKEAKDKPSDDKSSVGGTEADSKGNKDGETDTKKKKLKSELIQEKIDAANAKIESLTEKKSEMVWLMKQVIKAEMKRKLMDPRKKESS